MRNITLGQIEIALAFLVALIGSIEFISIRFRRKVTKILEPIYQKIDNLELITDKNFLVRFLSDVEQGQVIDEIEW